MDLGSLDTAQVSTERPFFSIFSATRNSEKWAAKCVESIRSQDFAAWEMFYVDDASTDDTTAYAVSSAADDPRVTIITNPHHIGKVANFLATYLRMRGEVILIIDGDDWLSRPDALRLIHSKYADDVRVDATFGRICGRHFGQSIQQERPRYAATIDVAWMPHSWRREITDRILQERPQVFRDPASLEPWANGGDVVLVSPAMCFARRIADVGVDIYYVSGSRDGETTLQKDCIASCRRMWLAIEREMWP